MMPPVYLIIGTAYALRACIFVSPLSKPVLFSHIFLSLATSLCLLTYNCCSQNLTFRQQMLCCFIHVFVESPFGIIGVFHDFCDFVLSAWSYAAVMTVSVSALKPVSFNHLYVHCFADIFINMSCILANACFVDFFDVSFVCLSGLVKYTNLYCFYQWPIFIVVVTVIITIIIILWKTLSQAHKAVA